MYNATFCGANFILALIGPLQSLIFMEFVLDFIEFEEYYHPGRYAV
jgi:hypothetical protein